LERPAETPAAARGGPEVGDVLPVEEDPPGGDVLQPAAGVERRRLPGAVRADQAGEAPEWRRQAQPVDGQVATESDRDARQSQAVGDRRGVENGHRASPTRAPTVGPTAA